MKSTIEHRREANLKAGKTPSGGFRPPLSALIHTKVPPKPTAADRARLAHPYVPPNSSPNIFGRHTSLSTPPRPKSTSDRLVSELASAFQEHEIDLGDIEDAETGEKLTPTKAVWSTTEGRLNMDRHTIIHRGTGEMDVSVSDPLRRTSPASPLRNAGAAIVGSSNVVLNNPQAQTPPKSRMNDLVARFLRTGPLLSMHHKYWSPETGQIEVPPGFINDEDGDAPPEYDYDNTIALIKSELSPRGDQSIADSVSSMGTNLVSSTSCSKGTQKRETPDERKARWKREKQERFEGKKGALAEAIAANARKPEEQPVVIAAPVQKDIVITDASTIASQLGDKLDPHDGTLWRAMEARYYKEVSEYALMYEANKWRTREKRSPGGIKGMDKECLAYASWRARTLRNLVSSIDEEQKRDVQRIEVEDQIVDAKKLQDVIAKHDEERHKHRLFVRLSLYEMEVLIVRKLYDLGILW